MAVLMSLAHVVPKLSPLFVCCSICLSAPSLGGLSSRNIIRVLATIYPFEMSYEKLKPLIFLVEIDALNILQENNLRKQCLYNLRVGTYLTIKRGFDLSHRPC